MNIKKLIHRKLKLFNLARIFGSYAFQPLFLLVHLTLDCNCRCSYCYQKNDPFYTNRKGFIESVQLENILADIKKNFLIKPKLHFFGGEPLLNPYFSQLLDLAENYGMATSMTTNGVLLNRHLEQILKSKLKQINISIDGIEEEHDKMRQLKGCFREAIDNIKKLRANEGKNKKIININAIVAPDNCEHLVDLALYFKDNAIDINVLAFQHMLSTPTNRGVRIDLGVLKSQIEKLKKLKTKFDILFIPEIKSEDLEKYYFSDDKSRFKNNCNMPWLGLSIFPNLDVAPAAGLLGCAQIVGNLRKETVKKIWNNLLMKKFRKNIVEHGLPENCFGCCYVQYY